jgi:hypothetical protein
MQRHLIRGVDLVIEQVSREHQLLLAQESPQLFEILVTVVGNLLSLIRPDGTARVGFAGLLRIR